MIKYLWYVFIFFIPTSYASIEILVQPNPAQVGQELQLIIKQKGGSNSQGVPDISVLEHDFHIVGTQQSTSYQLINGVSQHENIWTILLLPIHSGKIKIPSITIGTESTPVQEVHVLNEAQIISNLSSKSEPKSEANVWMQWDVQPEKPVLHEAIKIKIKIYHAVPLLDAKLSLPKVQNGLLFSVEEPKHSTSVQQGKRYEIETYEYFVYSQKLGKLSIHAPVLDALEYGVMPAPIRVSLPSKTLMISPVLAHGNSDVFPAKKLEYKELSTNVKAPQLMLGDAYTRTIRLRAKGAPYHLLPDLKFTCGTNCKVYTRIKQSSNKIVSRELQGQKIYEITYIPNQEGRIKIKDVDIPWFNTEKRVLEQLTIPGTELSISPEKKVIDRAASKPSKTPVLKHIPTWMSVLIGLFLGMLGALTYSRFNWLSIWDFLKQIEWKDRVLKQACKNQQANAARLALITWAKKHIDASNTFELHDILTYLPEGEFKRQIQKLIEFLYAKDTSSGQWNGQALWKAYKSFSFTKPHVKVEKKSANGLNP